MMNDCGGGGEEINERSQFDAGSFTRKGTEGWICSILALGSLILYIRTMAPTVWYGNSAAQQYACYILGMLHPTGYPLYMLLGKVFTFIPVGDIAYRVNLLSAVFSALTIPLVYLIARRVIGRRLPALLAALLFALSETFWSSAGVAKVYALNIFFMALTLYLLLRWGETERLSKDFSVLALFTFAYGLSLTHHRMMILLAPAYATYYGLTEHRMELKRLLALALLFLVPLLLYIYIPIRGGELLAQRDPANDYIYPSVPEAVLRGTLPIQYSQSWEGFIEMITGRDFAWQVHIGSWKHAGERLELWLNLLVRQFGLLGLPLGCIGAIWLTSTRARQAALLWIVYLATNIFALFMTGHRDFGIGPARIPSHPYFLPGHLVFAIWIGSGMEYLWSLVTVRQRVINKAQAYRAPYIAYYLLCLLLPFGLFRNNYARLDMSQDYAAYNHAQQVLAQPLGEGAVILGPSDLAASVRYFQYTADQRSDLIVISADLSSGAGRRLMENCIEAGRPLYLLDFPSEASKLAHPPDGQIRLTPTPLYKAPSPQFSLRANINDKVSLLGYDLEPSAVKQGQAFHFTLYWRALTEMGKNYHVFIHLIGPEGWGWGQIDQSPVSNYYPTSRWRAGQTFRDEYWLLPSPQAPAGDYHLELGLYHQDTMERLEIVDPRWEDADAVVIDGLTLIQGSDDG